MDSPLACYPGSQGSIPAFGKSNKQHSDGFSTSWYKVVGYRNGARHNLHFHIEQIVIILLATPSMGEHSISARYGKKMFRPFSTFLIITREAPL